MDEATQKLKEIFTAMENPEKWKDYRIAQIKLVTDQINIEKLDAFADYITKRFIDACNSKTIFGRFQNWKNISNETKAILAADIAKAFLQNIFDDIRDDRITLYTHDGDIYHKTDDAFDKQFKFDITKISEIKVIPSDINALMGVNRKGELYINMNFLLYKEANTPLIFLMDLRHEFMHIIDQLIPNISPLNPRIREAATFFYVRPQENREAYDKNPLEKHANLKRRDYRIAIEEMLKSQDDAISRTIDLTR